MKTISLIFLAIILLSLISPDDTAAQMKWYRHYAAGEQAMKSGNWQVAAKHFLAALEVKDKDKAKRRAAGAMFIKYFPHRELGICYYHLGKLKLAKRELSISLKQAPSLRARKYLRMVEERLAAGDVSEPVEEPKVPEQQTPKFPPVLDEPAEQKPHEVSQVGERLRIAILSFENKGDINGRDLVDKLITAFVKLERFKVLERAQLEKILEQHKLNMSGFIDAATAVEIGKGIGVDAVIIGSVNWSRNSVSIDARLIETETATIISAQNSYCRGSDEPTLHQMVDELVVKIKEDLPVVNGYVIAVEEEKITVDLGRSKGMKKGMKCFIYREGDPIIHPINKKVVGISIRVLSEIQLRDVYAEYAIGYIIREKDGIPRMGDMVITR